MTSTDATLAHEIERNAPEMDGDEELCLECATGYDGFVVIDGVCVLCPACKGTRIAGGAG